MRINPANCLPCRVSDYGTANTIHGRSLPEVVGYSQKVQPDWVIILRCNRFCIDHVMQVQGWNQTVSVLSYNLPNTE